MGNQKKVKMSGDKNEQQDTSVFITVIEVKEQIEKLLGFKTSDQKIFNFHSDEEFEDPKILQKCGIKGDCAMAYKPFELYLTTAENEWKKDVVEYSAPPELPDVMKPATDVEK